MTCELTVDAGAYVLGALAPAERASYERHLATCAACRREVGELAVLPGLLGRLDAETAASVGGAVPAPAPPVVLDSMLLTMGRERRHQTLRRRWQAAGALLAAACLVLLAGFGVAALRPAPGPPPPPVLAAMQATGPNVEVSGLIGYTSAGAGTDLKMLCNYDDMDGHSAPWSVQLVVYPKGGGNADWLKPWEVLPGQNTAFHAHSKLAPTEISRIELVRADNTTLLVYQPI